MRIDAHVAVPGKMFCGGQRAIFFDAADEFLHIGGHAFGSSPNERTLMMGLSGLSFTSASGANIQWMPAARASRAVYLPGVVCELRIARGGDGHGGRKRRAFVKAHSRAGFEIRADQQRDFRAPLKFVHASRRLDKPGCVSGQAGPVRA